MVWFVFNGFIHIVNDLPIWLVEIPLASGLALSLTSRYKSPAVTTILTTPTRCLLAQKVFPLPVNIQDQQGILLTRYLL